MTERRTIIIMVYNKIFIKLRMLEVGIRNECVVLWFCVSCVRDGREQEEAFNTQRQQPEIINIVPL